MAGKTESASTTQFPRHPWMDEASVAAVMTALADAGGSPRFVGGCVRDAILRRPIKDIDIATVLPPEKVQDALQAASIKYVSPGFDHGTITAILPDRIIEVTTLRRDVATDGRHAQVAYTDDWREDAMRRDFTMNALFLSHDGVLVDYTGGLDDAKAGRVRFVGSAADRIQEDYLRILRFFRFLAHYGKGDPDPEALDACRINAPGLENLSGERLAKEFFRLLEAQDPAPALRLMEETGCLHPFGVGPFGIERLAGLPAEKRDDPALRFMALLSDDTAVATAAIDRLKLSNAIVKRIVAARDGFRLDGPAIETQLYRNGAPAVLDSAMLQQAGGDANADLQAAIDMARNWKAPVFPIKGQDILDLGMPPGPDVGAILGEIEDWWIEQKFEPGRDACLKKAQNLTS